MEYYTATPPEPSKVTEALGEFLDGALDPLLETDKGSLPIKFLYKYFGPGSAANELNKVITREDGFFYLDGVKIIADTGPKAEIAEALTLALRAVALGILGGASLPIALEVAVAGGAAALATWVYEAFAEPIADRIYEIFGVASTRLEITDSSGQSVSGVVYRNGLAAEGKSAIDAALSLLNFSAGKFNVNSHVAVYINGSENIGYDVLAGDYLAQIAGAMGDAPSKISNGTGIDANGATAKNADLLIPYLSGAAFTVMQTGAKLGLKMYSHDNFGNGEPEYFLKKEISVGGDLRGLDLQSTKIAVFGTGGVDNFDLGAATGKVYVYGGMGADSIRGGRGGDVLWGDSPAGSNSGEVDVIHGAGGDDEIFGGAGGDQLYGDDGADHLDGGSGDDTIDGGTETDQIWGGVGADVIHGGEGADVIRGGSSVPGENDTNVVNKLYGDGGNDEIYGAEGNDQLFGGADEDKLSGGAGNDKLFGGAGNDRLTGGAGGDQFYVGWGDVILDSDAADKLFFGGAPSEEEADYFEVSQPELAHVFVEYGDLKGNYLEGYNHFYLGQGGDAGTFINTGQSLVILNGPEANPDYILAKNYQTGDFGLDVYDPAKFASKAKQHYEENRNGWPSERFILTPYLESLRIALGLEAQANQANKAGRSELFQVLETPTEIAGTEDIDFLQGTAGNDEITGGGEMDLLLGGAGSDIYRYALGDGDDYVMDYDGTSDDVDVLAFADLNASDIEISGGGADLYISVLGTQPSTITVTNQFAETGLEGIDEIQFADGTTWSREHILEAMRTVPGTDGNDELYIKAQQINGEWQPTVFVGGHGDDHLYGGGYGDIYVYAKGDGNDTIQDFGDNSGTLRLSDLNPADIGVSSLPDHSILITVHETGETIKVKPYSDQSMGFDQIVFANGTIWGRDDILAAVHAPKGATLSSDQVAENADNGTVVGTVAGVDPDADAVLTYSLTNDAGGRFAIDAATGQITVTNGALLDYESATSHAVTVRVTDQTGLTFDKSFTIEVTDVNESVNHAPTDATLVGGSVAENAASGTIVGTVAGIDPDAGAVLTYSLSDNAGGRFAIDATTGQITVADGTLLDYEATTSHAITVHVVDQGGLAFDKVFTIALTDVNEAGNQAPSDATLSGGTTAENSGNGVVVGTVAGVDPDNGAVLTYSLVDDAGGRFAINATTGQILVANGALLDYESTTAHNVTVRVTDQGGLTYDEVFALNVTDVAGVTLSGTSAANTLTGTAEDDVINGLDGNDVLNGLGGNDALDGGTGSDTMSGGAGNDIYIVDAAGDVVNENADEGTDEIRTSLSSYTLGANVENVTATTSTALTASGNALDNVITGNSGNDVLFGEDGNDTLLGGTGDDVLQGNAGNDIFDGQGGQNWITTGSGQDTLIFNAASGYLQVDDFSDGNDKINMRGTGITLQNAAQNVTLTEYAEGGVLVEFGTSQIWFENVMPGQITFDGDFIFDTSGGGDNHAPSNATLSGGSVAENAANGTVVGTVTGIDPDAGAVLSYSLTNNAGGRFAINATTGQITVANGALLDYETATSHNVSVHVVDQGGLSFDKVFTLTVADVAGATQNGTSAADTLIGTNEADTLNGLGGNDTLNGLGDNDVLDGGAGDDIMTGGTGNDIYIVDSDNDVVTESANEGIDEVQTSLSSYTLGDNFENLTGTNSGGFTAAGNALDNVITGSSGNDVLFGEDGNDTLRGGAGDDVMQGGAGNDTFQGLGGVKWITTGDGADNLVFNSSSGAFQVDDFTDGSDKIDMRGTGVTAQNAAQNVTLTEYAEGGVLVQFGSSEIWLADVMPGQITFADDFILS
ncbi:Ca2+-binding RTX toxin-like protein [Bradyrhizobium yuanmingense]|uniref:cadherin domain-containing protein n=1 Tax=Bradyrhizobium yuanmingense TaxID=108015 RepID=UPI0035191A1C